MVKQIVKIASSIVIGILLLRFGYNFENDWLSIFTQSLGYIIISYPFILFFGFLFNKIKNDIKLHQQDKIFYSQKGIVYGRVYVGNKPLRNVKCNIKNVDGTLHPSSHKWIGVTDSNGYFEVKYIPDGEYLCVFSHTFTNDNTFVINKEFKIIYGEHKEIIIEIEEKKDGE